MIIDTTSWRVTHYYTNVLLTFCYGNKLNWSQNENVFRWSEIKTKYHHKYTTIIILVDPNNYYRTISIGWKSANCEGLITGWLFLTNGYSPQIAGTGRHPLITRSDLLSIEALNQFRLCLLPKNTFMLYFNFYKHYFGQTLIDQLCKESDYISGYL